MKTIKTVEIEPVFIETIPDILEENKIYISEQNKVSIHLCLCGCKTEVVLIIGYPHWNHFIKNDKLTIVPSIGNFQIPCKSHYVITNNKANIL
jgi:hypothetical protein